MASLCTASVRTTTSLAMPRHQLQGVATKRNVGRSSRRPGSRDPPRLVTRATLDDEDFEARLARLRKKGASGTGKKAEERKARKEGVSPSESSFSGDGSPKRAAIESLPAVPLEDPVSDGFPVVLGFSAYSEHLNGRAAALGLVGLLAVELASGESLFKFHDGATIGVQLYVLAGLGALYVKSQKEKDSVWPK